MAFEGAMKGKRGGAVKTQMMNPMGAGKGMGRKRRGRKSR